MASQEPLGSLLIAEEALGVSFVLHLRKLIKDQPSWSDLPILILTAGGREGHRNGALDYERLGLGTPVLLERPIRTMTLISSVRAALRARQRQYEIRDALIELKDGQETIQAVLDNLPVGVVLARATGEIVLTNQSVERILGHPVIRSPTSKSHEWIAFHPDGRRVQASEFPLARAINSGMPVPPEEYLYQRGDGSLGWISLTASPIIGDDSVTTGGVVAVTDIDHQKHAELALIQSEKLAAVGRLAASISHEINNPLESVTNLLYLARQKNPDDREVQTWLDLADGELRRVSQIVSQTLRFHRQATKPRAITPEELLEPTLGLYQGRLNNANISLTLQHRGADPIVCYEGDMRQVLNNLIGNAIDAMRNGGRLIIRTSNSFAFTHARKGIRITVADTGPGMPDSVVSHIFDAFYTTKGLNGTGLGLWISKGIVDKHNGFIQVKSSVRASTGTAFSVFLPLNTSPVDQTDGGALD
ncbi:sensor histidine kinase [Tunturiibacter lichenicola]|uniref:sensor histidine kinase n=1 Tax=Tunturiibacter lichenicola TaxID=2051959 RepID=UPI0021B28A8D|nr:ATP-binding protein [Edaphobacter lichenicola]